MNSEEKIIIRPPVVVIMGHVDSGKTSLLDAIRKSNLTKKESGGITQHIGAYQIERNGKKITFLDTPGHEAFSQIRSRGAKIADIAVLMIDAVNGVEKQTKEAIQLIKKANLALIIAINKVDKQDANPTKAKRELTKEGIIIEEYGGDTPVILTSTVTGQGINELLDMIQLVGDMRDLKVNIDVPAQATIIETYFDSKKGSTITVIVNEGILKTGEIVATNSAIGKIKRMENPQKEVVLRALPGDPIKLWGFDEPPVVGEILKVFENYKTAENQIVKKTKEKNIKEALPEGAVLLNIVLKTDCFSSREAIEEILRKIPQEKVRINFLKKEIGDIGEKDVEMAKDFKATIIGFRVKLGPTARKIILREKIRILNFEIIYELVEGVRKEMLRVTEPEIVRVNLGKIKVLKEFINKGNRQIVGGRVIEGEIKKSSFIEIWRNEELIGKVKLINLQKNKKDVNICKKGEEVGLMVEGNEKINEGDVLIIFVEEKRKEI